VVRAVVAAVAVAAVAGAVPTVGRGVVRAVLEVRLGIVRAVSALMAGGVVGAMTRLGGAGCAECHGRCGAEHG
jgi:hypothetical protein